MRRVSIVLLAILLAFLSIVLGKIPNPYKVLGIPQSATEEDIKTAFKKRSRKYHPDINKEDPKAKEKFEKVVNAYELLKDPERRRMYDLTGD
jgi:curved DNA-binding protein